MFSSMLYHYKSLMLKRLIIILFIFKRYSIECTCNTFKWQCFYGDTKLVGFVV